MRTDGARPTAYRSRQFGFGASLGVLLLLFVHGAVAVQTRSGTVASPNEPTSTSTEDAASSESASQTQQQTWWSWLWSLFVRAKPPPVVVPEPDERRKACDGVLVCATAVFEKTAELAAFGVCQFGRLLWSPLVFTEGFVTAAVVLVRSLREVETVVLAAVLWFAAMNVVAWGLLRLASPYTVALAIATQLSRLPVVQLFRYIWLRIPSMSAPPTPETKQLTAQIRRLEARIAETEVTRAAASNVARVETTPTTPATGPSAPEQRRMTCWWCGSPGHLQADCPFKPKKPKHPCPLCGGRHWKRACPKQNVEENLTESHVRRLYHVNGQISKSVDSPRSVMQFLVDTGATVNLLPKATIEEMGVPVVDSPIAAVKSFAGTSHPVEGEVQMRSIVGDQEAVLTYLVVPGVPRAILGLPGLTSLGLTIKCAEDLLETPEGTRVYCHQVGGADLPSQKNC